jgi:hypothetical protein
MNTASYIAEVELRCLQFSFGNRPPVWPELLEVVPPDHVRRRLDRLHLIDVE